MQSIYQRRSKLFILIGALLVVTNILQFTGALAQNTDPWNGLVVSNEQVTYTQKDAERYLKLYRESWEMGREDQKGNTLEKAADFDQDLIKNGELKTKLYSGLPDPSDISQDDAVCIAYAWVEQKYGLSDDAFIKFFPQVSFWVNTDDDDLKLWNVSFILFDNNDYVLYGDYHIYINSQNGVIVRSSDASTAEG